MMKWTPLHRHIWLRQDATPKAATGDNMFNTFMHWYCTAPVLFSHKNSHLGFLRSILPGPKPVTPHKMSLEHILTISVCHRTIQFSIGVTVARTQYHPARGTKLGLFCLKNASHRSLFGPFKVVYSRLLCSVDVSYKFIIWSYNPCEPT